MYIKRCAATECHTFRHRSDREKRTYFLTLILVFDHPWFIRQSVGDTVITLNIIELIFKQQFKETQWQFKVTTDVVLVEGARRGELSSETRVTSSSTTPTASSISSTPSAPGGGGPEPGERALVTRHQDSGHGAPGPAPGTPGAAAAEISRHSTHAGPAQPGHRQVQRLRDPRLESDY